LTRRRSALLIIQSLLGLGLLVAWAWIVDLGEVGRTLSSAIWQFVLAAALINIATTVLRAIRWRLILRPIARVPLREIWFISFASSLINFIIPLRTGEVARAVLLKQRHRVPMSAALPTIAVDRSLDLLAVLLEGVLGAAIGIHLDTRLEVGLLFGVVLMLVFAVAVALAITSGDRALDLVERALPRRLAGPLRERSMGILRGFVAGFAAIGRRPADVLRILILSLAAALIDAGGFYLLFVSLGISVAPAIVLTGYALFVLTYLIPGAPGYVGSAEAFGSLIFGSLGVPTALAASTIVLSHALNAVVLAIAGGASIWGLGLRPAEAVRSFVTPATQEPSLESTDAQQS
jgi:uncharacterized protein (TIRG00374 family)